ncbi:hypothetical protein [Megalodesulfovibrio paquesii]
MTRPLLLLLLLLVMLPGWTTPAAAQARDITADVIEKTQADELLAGLCQQFCLGNQRQGTIQRVTAVTAPDGKVTIEAAVALRSADDNPYFPFDQTVVVAGHGLLDPATCRFTVGMARVERDFQGIFQALLQQYGHFAGWEYDIPNCRTLLAP